MVHMGMGDDNMGNLPPVDSFHNGVQVSIIHRSWIDDCDLVLTDKIGVAMEMRTSTRPRPIIGMRAAGRAPIAGALPELHRRTIAAAAMVGT